MFEQAEPGTEYVIARYRDTNVNLRTQLERIIGRAGVKSWPKLFQNLRASRVTELAAEFPAHVAAEWLGHSTLVAQKHYWQVTEADFQKAGKAAQNPAQQPHAEARKDSCDLTPAHEKTPEKPGSAVPCDLLHGCSVPPVGLEPTTY
ncbi:MAG: hypothetical protein U0836_21405 [Pirellulales bacterium]